MTLVIRVAFPAEISALKVWVATPGNASDENYVAGCDIRSSLQSSMRISYGIFCSDAIEYWIVRNQQSKNPGNCIFFSNFTIEWTTYLTKSSRFHLILDHPSVLFLSRAALFYFLSDIKIYYDVIQFFCKFI